MAIQGQANYGNANQARLGAVTEIANLITNGLPMAEGIALGTVIYKTNSGYSTPSFCYTQLTDTRENYVN